MHEDDRAGVNIVVTTGSALAGFAVGGPVGAVAGAVLPELVRELQARRIRQVEDMAGHGCDLAGFTGPELAAWARSSEQHAAFLQEAVEAAWTALDAAKVRTLGYVLADGIQDEARLDIDQLVIRALRELEAAHVRQLTTMAEQAVGTEYFAKYAAEVGGWILMGEGSASILATLERTGCVRVRLPEDDTTTFGPNPFEVTRFGHACLRMIREATVVS